MVGGYVGLGGLQVATPSSRKENRELAFELFEALYEGFAIESV